MRTAQKEMKNITAHFRVQPALKHRHYLRPHLPFQFGDKVRIRRVELNRFTRPFTAHGYDNEKTVYLMTEKIRLFSTSVVRLIPPEKESRVSSRESESVQPAIMPTAKRNQTELSMEMSKNTSVTTAVSESFLTTSKLMNIFTS